MQSINNLCFVIAGGTPKTNHPEYWNGNIPWISIKDFPQVGRYISQTEKTITESGLEHSAAHLLEPNDVIISARGTVGKARLVSRRMAFNQSCFGLRTKNTDVLNQLYLFYWLCSHLEEIRSGTHGAVFDTITRSDFDRLKLDLPSIQRQQHIVGVIGSVDDLIELNARKIAKIMDFSRLIYSQAKAISPMKSAGEFISFTKGKQADFVNQPTGEPYLTIDVLEGSQEVSYSASGVECGEGDILMVMDGAASGRCYFGYKGFVGSTLSKIECKGIDSSVAFLALEEHEKDIQKNTTGSAIPHTDKRYVSDIEIPLIKDEFTVNRLRNLLTLLVSTRKEIRTLREEKEILMRKFF